jgi:hypothetical protein
LHPSPDGHVEAGDAAGDLIEPGELGGAVGNLLRRRLGNHVVAGRRRRVERRHGRTRLALPRRQRGERWLILIRGPRRRQRPRLDSADAATGVARRRLRRRGRAHLLAAARYAARARHVVLRRGGGLPKIAAEWIELRHGHRRTRRNGGGDQKEFQE